MWLLIKKLGIPWHWHLLSNCQLPYSCIERWQGLIHSKGQSHIVYYLMSYSLFFFFQDQVSGIWSWCPACYTAKGDPELLIHLLNVEIASMCQHIQFKCCSGWNLWLMHTRQPLYPSQTLNPLFLLLKPLVPLEASHPYHFIQSWSPPPKGLSSKYHYYMN